MSTVFICLILVTLVNGYSTYSVTVTLDNICSNIYDHGNKSSLTQLVMSVFASSGEKRDVLYYSSDLHTIDDNPPVHFFTPDSTASSFELHDLSVRDNLTFTFYASIMVGKRDETDISLLCPKTPRLFDHVVDPWTMFRGESSSITTNKTSVDISKMICSTSPYAHTTDKCDGNNQFNSDSINLKLSFDCQGSCGDLVTTTTIPPTTTTTTATTTTAQPTTTSTSTTSQQQSTSTNTTNATDFTSVQTSTTTETTSSDPKPTSTALIAVATIAAIELIVIGIVVFFCLRMRQRRKTKNVSEPEQDETPPPTPEVRFSAVTAEIDDLYANSIALGGTTARRDEPEPPPLPPRMIPEDPDLDDTYADVSNIRQPDGNASANNDLYA